MVLVSYILFLTQIESDFNLIDFISLFPLSRYRNVLIEGYPKQKVLNDHYLMNTLLKAKNKDKNLNYFIFATNSIHIHIEIWQLLEKFIILKIDRLEK